VVLELSADQTVPKARASPFGYAQGQPKAPTFEAVSILVFPTANVKKNPGGNPCGNCLDPCWGCSMVRVLALALAAQKERRTGSIGRYA
jgi:hypothetical protein